jgi:hypothetical protein
VVKIVGLHVVDFFAGETGSHVWDSVGAGTEVIRVRAFAADDRMTCREILEDHVARRRVFDAALEAGEDPLPDNTEALLTVIRAIRFDPPRNESRVAPLTIEDYGLADARRAELASPVPLLSELLRVRMTRIDEGRDG